MTVIIAVSASCGFVGFAYVFKRFAEELGNKVF